MVKFEIGKSYRFGEKHKAQGVITVISRTETNVTCKVKAYNETHEQSFEIQPMSKLYGVEMIRVMSNYVGADAESK
jgi:hypothetical protein